MKLRDYQQASIDKLRDGIKAGFNRQVLTCPTGAGKSRIAGGLIELATARGKRVAFICNRIELVLQAFDGFKRLGIDCGIIQGDNSINTSAPVLVCSIQTLARRGYPDADLYIVDECHTAAASKEFHNLFYSRNNVPVIGLTATPFAKGMAKHHDALAGPLFDNLIVGATIPQLIDAGFLVDVEIYAPSEPDLSGVKIVAGDYQEDQLTEAVDKPKLVGDIIEHYKRLADGKKTIVFATSIAHSMHIVEAFTKAGYRAKHLDAYTEAEERRAIINGFKAGEFDILSNCSLLAEGFDCPETECIILARPTRSLIRYIQMAGRALRPFHGKDKALILDHSGTVKRLGFPTDDLPMVLDDGKQRAAPEKKESLPKICKSCFAVRPAGVKKCPQCGFEPTPTPEEILHEAGELKKVEKKKRDNLTMDEKASIYSALIGFARSKGMRDGWAYHKYNEMIGCYPSNQMPKEPGPMVERVQDWLTHERIKKAKSPIKCPKCSGRDYTKMPGAGPHKAGARCKGCGAHWWLGANHEGA